MRVPSIVGAIGAIVLAAALACGPKPATTPVDSKTPISCAVLQPLGAPEDTVVVALFDDVDPRRVAELERLTHVPGLTNESERFVLRQLEDTSRADTACAASGFYRLAIDESFNDGSIVLQPTDAQNPVIRCVDARSMDPRDLLEQSDVSVDLIVLDDRATIEYAASLGRYQDVPLAPDRGYVLLSVTRALARGDSLPDLPTSICASLALDAVSSRYAQALHFAEWAAIVGNCTVAINGIMRTEASPSSRVLYDAGDSTARDLADRIVALLMGDEANSLAFAEAVPHAPGAGSVFISVGVSSDELAERLWAGDEFAYVVSVPLDPAGTCLAAQLGLSAPWLTRRPDWPQQTILPLVKTRPFALAARRPGGFGFDLRPDARGSVRICGVRR